MRMSGVLHHKMKNKTHSYIWKIVKEKDKFLVIVDVDNFYGNWDLSVVGYLYLDNDNRFYKDWSEHQAMVSNNDGGDEEICADVFDKFIYMMEKEYPFFFTAQ